MYPEVLDSVRAQKLSSVAFPLIGCGRFGLDEKMLILQFLDAVETLGNRLQDGENLKVWLVILDHAQFESAAGVLLELLLRARNEMIVLQIEQSGVPILDRFAARLTQRTNEGGAKWQLCRRDIHIVLSSVPRRRFFFHAAIKSEETK